MEDDVRALFNHDPALVLGRNTAGTLRLSADATGLRYEIDPPDTQTVRENLRRDGSVFVRELTEGRLSDVGPVTYPAETTSTSGPRTTGPRSARADADLIALALAVMSMESGGNPATRPARTTPAPSRPASPIPSGSMRPGCRR